MLYTFSRLKQFENLVHVVTSAHYEAIDHFNIADHVGPERQNAIRNRKMVCEKVGLNFSRLTTGQQVHKTNVAVVTDENLGAGRDGWASAIPETDALITNMNDVPLLVMSADCPLILIYDPASPALGTVHASWRCTFGGIIGKTVQLMTERFGSDPQNLYAGIGPGAGPCCYEIDDAFIQTISQRPELLPHVFDCIGKKHYNLFGAGKSELMRAGLPAAHIEVMGLCTICNEDFFSFRRQAKDAGRFALIASMKK
jgi:YfiH family protein